MLTNFCDREFKEGMYDGDFADWLNEHVCSVIMYFPFRNVILVFIRYEILMLYLL